MTESARPSPRVALVVGGSRGIGRAIAVRLARSGFDIWLTYKGNHEAANRAKAEIEGHGRKCDLLAFDIADYGQTESALAGRLEGTSPDVLVFNAGITRDNLLMFMTREEWNAVLRTNLDGFYNVTKFVVFAMLKRKAGRIVVISSTSGQIGQPGQVNYAASKAGLIGAAKALAREAGKKNVLVNVVAPGFVETEMTKDVDPKHVLPMIPLNRIGKAEEVAAVVDFLCTEPDMYVHGQVIGVNGGIT